MQVHRLRRLPHAPWQAPIVILFSGAAPITGTGLWPDVEGGHRSLATLSACGLTFFALHGLGVVLFRVQPPYGWVSFLTVLLLLTLFRIEGFSGDLYPELNWRFGRKKDVALVDKLPLGSSDRSSQPVDVATTTTHDFPQFLGPTRDGKVLGVRLARDWSQTPRCLWRQPIGPAGPALPPWAILP